MKYLKPKTVFYLFTGLFPVILVVLIGFYFSFYIFTTSKQDTTSITNGAFAIVAAFASMCFACARAINQDDDDRDKFVSAGEGFFHSGILWICASLLKYAALTFQKHQYAGAITTVVGIFIGIIFPIAVIEAAVALFRVSSTLWKRSPLR